MLKLLQSRKVRKGFYEDFRRWLPGEYLVEFYVEGRKISQVSYKIF